MNLKETDGQAPCGSYPRSLGVFLIISWARPSGSAGAPAPPCCWRKAKNARGPGTASPDVGRSATTEVRKNRMSQKRTPRRLCEAGTGSRRKGGTPSPRGGEMYDILDYYETYMSPKASMIQVRLPVRRDGVISPLRHRGHRDRWTRGGMPQIRDLCKTKPIGGSAKFEVSSRTDSAKRSQFAGGRKPRNGRLGSFVQPLPHLQVRRSRMSRKCMAAPRFAAGTGDFLVKTGVPRQIFDPADDFPA